MKPLWFLSLSLAFGLGGMLFARPASAKITDGKKACVEDFATELKKLSKTDLTKLDPNTRCTASDEAENNKAPDFTQRKKLKLSQGEETGTSFSGACQSSYEAVQLVYEKLLESRKETCDKIYVELDEKFPDCLGSKPAESCKEKIDEMVGIYTNGKNRLQKDIDDSIEFLKKHSAWNTEAKDRFKKDLDQLQNIRAANRPEILSGLVTPPEVQHQVNAATQGSASLADYLTKLETRKPHRPAAASKVSGATLPAISPIDEQEDARKFVKNYSENLLGLKASEDDSFRHQLSAFRESLQHKLDTPGGDTFKKVVNYAPAAAPIASTLLMNNGADAASSIAGSTGALPALAMVGAAGAAGIAMGSKSVSGADVGSSLGGVQGPVMTPNNKAPGTEFGGSGKDQTAAPLPTSPLDSAGGGNNEKAAETNTAMANNGALAAALGGGASVMPSAGKSKTKREVASTAAAAGAGEEALKPFTGELRPSPRPAASPDSAGNDVSNLLGKMKDLFNMDDPFSGDTLPPDMSAGGPAVGPAGAAAPGDEYVGEDYSGGEEYQADTEYGAGEEAYQSSNPMGNIEVTLFRRVHARHVKCMEKGLVILMSQELPE